MDTARIDTLRKYTGEDKIVTSHEMKIRLVKEKAAEYDNVKSGIPGIDRACEGFRDVCHQFADGFSCFRKDFEKPQGGINGIIVTEIPICKE